MIPYSKIDSLKVGDFVLYNGRPRKILYIHIHGSDRATVHRLSFYFRILRCSWTTRAHTIYYDYELHNNPEWSLPKGMMPKSLSKMERKIVKDCIHLFPSGEHITCCEVTHRRR